MAKKVNPETVLYVLAAGVVGYVAWMMYKNTSATKARDEIVLDVAGTIADTNHWQGVSGAEHFVPASSIVGAPVVGSVSASVAPSGRYSSVAILPHRYPPYSGTNLSVLTVNGLQPLLRPAPTDYDYLIRPPSEVNL